MPKGRDATGAEIDNPSAAPGIATGAGSVWPRTAAIMFSLAIVATSVAVTVLVGPLAGVGLAAVIRALAYAMPRLLMGRVDGR
jgi:hypothetical protein